jgi:hypothetical protein
VVGNFNSLEELQAAKAEITRIAKTKNLGNRTSPDIPHPEETNFWWISRTGKDFDKTGYEAEAAVMTNGRKSNVVKGLYRN